MLRLHKYPSFYVGETGAVLLGLLLMEINIIKIKGA